MNAALFSATLVFLIQIVSMPSDIDGDGQSIRKVSAWFAQHGEWGIPYTERDALGRLVERRNQWFIENDERQRFYSRWGEANTAFYVLSEWLKRPDGLQVTERQLVYTNVLNAFFAAGIAFYLALIAGLFSVRPVIAVFFVLTALYANFTWHYLRIQTYEIFQLAFFTVFAYHALSCARRFSMSHLIFALLALSVATHVKPLFFIFFAVTLVLAWTMAGTKHRLKSSGLVVLFAISSLAIHLIIAAHKLGYWSLSGDAPPPEGWISDFHFSYVPVRLHDYLLGIKSGLPFYFPQLAVAAFCWPAFHREYRRESLFLLSCLAVTLPALLTFCSYGEWCYGPRYWVFLLPLMLVPVLGPLTGQKAKTRWMTLTALIALSLPALFVQWQFNSRPFFLRQNLNAFLVNSGPQSAQGMRYLADAHDALVAYDLNKFLAGGTSYSLISGLVAHVGPERTGAIHDEMRKMLSQQFQCNFYFRFLCD